MPLVALAEHRPPSLRALRARSRPAARHHRRAAPGRPAHHLRRPGNRPAGHVDILTDLVALDEAPWGDINGGRPLDPRRLARELAQYHVTPVPFRTGGQITKGYVAYPTSGQLGFADAWSRYLPTDNNDGEEDSWNH
ncbi:DUF3631 domain-containing protein [Actinophytocola sp.]|uniref:DUF3631 domain-containing protein n=1 Tax=Actinophytocola sp. TaxID=1872138 RepID=UPI003BB8EAE7